MADGMFSLFAKGFFNEHGYQPFHYTKEDIVTFQARFMMPKELYNWKVKAIDPVLSRLFESGIRQKLMFQYNPPGTAQYPKIHVNNSFHGWTLTFQLTLTEPLPERIKSWTFGISQAYCCFVQVLFWCLSLCSYWKFCPAKKWNESKILSCHQMRRFELSSMPSAMSQKWAVHMKSRSKNGGFSKFEFSRANLSWDASRPCAPPVAFQTWTETTFSIVVLSLKQS